MKDQIRKCPKCSDDLYISEYACDSCGTTLRGEFPIEESHSSFERLTEEDRYFVLVFLQTGGRIQDVERVMGMSYPTVKAKLQEVQAKLKGERNHWDEDDFDSKSFKREMKEFKRALKHKIRSQVRRHMRSAMGPEVHIQADVISENDPQDWTSADKHCCKDDVEINLERKTKIEKLHEIIDQLEKGEIDPEKAQEMIREL